MRAPQRGATLPSRAPQRLFGPPAPQEASYYRNPDEPDDPAMVARVREQLAAAVPVQFSWLTIEEHRSSLKLPQDPSTFSARDKRLSEAVKEERERYRALYRKRARDFEDLYSCCLLDVRSYVDGTWVEHRRSQVVKQYSQNWIRDPPEPIQGLPAEIWSRVQEHLLRGENSQPIKSSSAPLVSSKLRSLLSKSAIAAAALQEDLSMAEWSQRMKVSLKQKPPRLPLALDTSATDHPDVLAGEIDVIITGSALEELIAASTLALQSAWSVPFSVLSIPTEAQPEPGEQTPTGPAFKRVIVVDKPLLPSEVTPRSKNEIFFRRWLKELAYKPDSDPAPFVYSTIVIGDLKVLVRHRPLGILSTEDESVPIVVAGAFAFMSYLPDRTWEQLEPSEVARMWIRQLLAGPESVVLTGSFDPVSKQANELRFSSFIDKVVPLDVIHWVMYLATVLSRPLWRVHTQVDRPLPANFVMHHRTDGDSSARFLIEFMHEANANELSDSRSPFYDLWTAQKHAAKTKLDLLTCGRAPEWNPLRRGHVPGTFSPLMNIPGEKQSDKYCFGFESSGVCNRGEDCLFPHLDSREANELRRLGGSDLSESPLAVELRALRRTFDSKIPLPREKAKGKGKKQTPAKKTQPKERGKRTARNKKRADESDETSRPDLPSPKRAKLEDVDLSHQAPPSAPLTAAHTTAPEGAAVPVAQDMPDPMSLF